MLVIVFVVLLVPAGYEFSGKQGIEVKRLRNQHAGKGGEVYGLQRIPDFMMEEDAIVS